MNKNNTVIAVTLICLIFTIFIGCQNFKTSSVEPETNVLDSIGQDTLVRTKVLKFSYENHNYVEFLRDDRSYVVHDPNCGCLSKKLNNITTVITKNTTENIESVDNNNRKNFRVIIDKITEIDKKISSKQSVQTKSRVVTKKQPVKKTKAKK